ncbi:neutral/alkaline non-lysosomal ceramidase N-terminal domain-containing protein [Bacteroidota bacterium]
MKTYINFIFYISILLLCFSSCQQNSQNNQDLDSSENNWKAGVARMVITPEENMWMAGYAARTKPAEGKTHDLWVKALALDDGNGNQGVLVTADIIGFSRELSKSICNRLQKEFKLDRKDIILSSSHTHSCPVCNKNLINIYPPFNKDQLDQINRYQQFLEEKVVKCVINALNSTTPAGLSTGIGMARFAVNRRNNMEKDVLHATVLKGPSDHTVPVIKMSNPDGSTKAIVVGYACHATTLDGLLWSGDYPGYSQMELEKAYPGSTALFFAGCGGDQNPIPRRSIQLAEQYGSELAAAVIRVIKEPMNEQKPALETLYNEIELEFSEPLSMEELREVERNAGQWQAQWAKYYIEKINRDEVIPEKYPFYPVQSWKLGDQILVSLGGEVVVDYALRIKKTWGNDLIIAAYTNDVMAYIPSERVLEEGGYEGNTSMRAYSQPSTWAPGIEERIISEVNNQLQTLGREIQGN